MKLFWLEVIQTGKMYVSDKHGGFSKHENSNVHKHSIEIATKSMGDVGGLLTNDVKKEKERNRAYLQKLLQNLPGKVCPSEEHGFHLNQTKKVVVLK